MSGAVGRGLRRRGSRPGEISRSVTWVPVSTLLTDTRMRSHLPPARVAPADWSQAPLARTWQTLSTLCWALAVATAMLHPLPAVALSAAATWAHFKANPSPALRKRRNQMD